MFRSPRTRCDRFLKRTVVIRRNTPLSSAWCLLPTTLSFHYVHGRAGQVVAKADEVHGPGTSRVKWCDSSVYMLTTGMSKLSREREFAVWDARSLSAPVNRTRVGGTSSGFLLPHLQFGLGLVTLCGRGDSTVR